MYGPHNEAGYDSRYLKRHAALSGTHLWPKLPLLIFRLTAVPAGRQGWPALKCPWSEIRPGRPVAWLALLLSGSALAAAPATPPAHAALVESKCNACHNSTDWAGGLAFDTLDFDQLHADAEVWEETIRKLRGRLMPPPGEPQPDQAEIDAFVGWLETRLDSAAASAPPDPGYVGLHRLNRNEYGREIQRILDLKVDVTELLPRDVYSDGFDNQAATLRMSPSFLDQYIGAARAVARQAIGRADAKSNSREYRAPSSLDQSKHVDGLPLGTRGGFWVDHHFPADGEYVFSIREFFAMGAGYVTKVDDPHVVILTIDGKRVFQQTYGGDLDQKHVDQRQAIAADEIQNRFNQIRVPVKAGVRRVGVTFIARSFAQSDSPLQPIAMLPEMERVPRIPGFTVAGPFDVTGVGDTPSRRRIFICQPKTPAEEPACARRILAKLAAAAFRRPVTEADLEAPMAFYERARATRDFDAGIEGGLTAILSSTKFLLRSAPAIDEPGRLQALTDLELATRLSFFLWSQGPDEELVDRAARGKLQDPKVLAAEVQRMLRDPRASALVDNFAFQWLNVARMGAFQVDPTLYPDFDHNLREALREEIRLFLTDTLRADRSVLDLIASDTTFVNERLARHYGLRDVIGDRFRPVKLADANRHGLLGKGALLMATSYGNRTSPVLRGAWVMDTLFGTPPAAPPPGVEQFPEHEPGKQQPTVRERLEQHRQQKSCNACHGVIDPLGFALENYDVIGAWRDVDLDAKQDIDARGQLASGVEVNGPAQLARAILARPEMFVQAFTERLMTYALGRPLRAEDMPAVRRIVREAAAKNYRLETLVQGIVASDAFRKRLPPLDGAEGSHVAHAGAGR
jgi:mono/diheme cytochrome c family protein